MNARNSEQIDGVARQEDCANDGDGREPAGDLNWLDSLEYLLVKYAGLGISPDVAALTLLELYGVYLFLVRISGD